MATSLPVDVLERIFSHLNETEDLYAAELVCKQWKQAIDMREMYRRLTIRKVSRLMQPEDAARVMADSKVLREKLRQKLDKEKERLENDEREKKDEAKA
mgnify:CR=1 FL=1